MKLTGRVWIKKNGILIAQGRNLVVSAGKALAASRIAGNGAGIPAYLAAGTDNAPTLDTMTALQGTEIARILGTVSSLNNEFRIEANLTITATATIGEVAIFNAASAGTMFARFTPAPFDVQNADVLQFQWAVALG